MPKVTEFECDKRMPYGCDTPCLFIRDNGGKAICRHLTVKITVENYY